MRNKRNQEKTRATYNAWRKANRDRVNAGKARNRLKHLEKDKAWRKAWNEANPDRIRLIWRKKEGKRRAAKLMTQVEDVDYAKVIADAKGLCGICRKPFDLFGIHVDHILPLSRGGTHTYDNLQATHAFCNMTKNAKVNVQKKGA